MNETDDAHVAGAAVRAAWDAYRMLKLLPVVLGKLRGFELLDPYPAQLPMIGGCLTAAFTGQGTVAWRDRYRPIPHTEGTALSFTLWLLADLYDFAAERPGATNELMLQTFDAIDDDGGYE